MTETATSGAASKKVLRQPMAGQVADDLRRRILAGEIAEGTQLLQEQLAAEFGISKVPVREALYQLEAEGYVTQQFHRGAVVSGLSPSQLMELFELRVQIEAWLLKLGMSAATSDDIAKARYHAEQFEQATDPVVAWDLNWRFHSCMYVPARKPFAIEHLEKIHSQSGRYVRLQYSKATNKQKIVDEHLELLESYARKDKKTITMLKEHILEAAKALTSSLREEQERKKA